MLLLTYDPLRTPNLEPRTLRLKRILRHVYCQMIPLGKAKTIPDFDLNTIQRMDLIWLRRGSLITFIDFNFVGISLIVMV